MSDSRQWLEARKELFERAERKADDLAQLFQTASRPPFGLIEETLDLRNHITKILNEIYAQLARLDRDTQ